jgi:type I restriction enzyme S subunit
MKNWQRYPEYKDSGVEWLGEIPKHWEVLKLKHLGDINLSNVDKKSKENEETVKLCNYVDVYYNDYITEKIEFMIATASYEQKKTFSLRKGDVLLTKDSETWNDIAIAAYVATDLDNVICGYHLAHIHPYQSKALGKYIFRSISSTRLREKFWIAANGVTRFGISKSSILSVLLPVPPLSEQKAIAHFLDCETNKLDNLIAKKERFIELLQEKRTALISHTVTKGLNPDVPMKDSGISWLGQIPQHWEVKKLKWFASTDSGSTPNSSKYSEYYENGSINWVRTLDLNDGEVWDTEIKITEKALKSTACKIMPIDTVMIAMYGGDGTIGKNGLLKINAAVNQAVCGIVTNKNYLIPSFLHRYVQFYRPYWMIDAMGARKDPNISQDIIRQLIVLLPPLSEQKAIAHFLDQETTKIDTLIEKTKTSIEKLKEYRTALISAAVTGKIDIRQEVIYTNFN